MIFKERKSFICELSKCNKIDDNLFKISNEHSQFTHIWLQGIIFKVQQVLSS